MGVHPALPVDGVTVIWGNDVVGGRVWADQPAQPVVVSVPIGSKGPDENEKQYPVTRAMKMASVRAEAYGGIWVLVKRTTVFCSISFGLVLRRALQVILRHATPVS